MTEAKLVKVEKKLDQYNRTGKYNMIQLIEYLQLEEQKYELLKKMRDMQIPFYEVNNDVRRVPTYAAIEGNRKNYEKLIQIYLPYMAASNAHLIYSPLYLCTMYYYKLQRPVDNIKILERPSFAHSYYKYLELNTTANKIIVHDQPIDNKQAIESAVAAYSQKKKAMQSLKHTSLGHTSFGRSRVARLNAEAADPPGYLVVADGHLPSALGDYKYKSTKFYLSSKDAKIKERCQIVIFDSIAQRDSYPKSDTASYLNCNFVLPSK